MRRTFLAMAASAMLVGTGGSAVLAQAEMSAEEIISGLPEGLSSLYENYVGDVVPAQLPEIAAGEKPWKMCHSESYQGNPWRVALSNEIERLANEFIEAGTLSEWKQSDANGDVQVQIQQVQAFIDEGCDIITMIPGSATGLDGAIDNAAAAGIPVVTISGAVTNPKAVNVDWNWWRWGYDMTAAIGEELGEGNVIVVEGIAGSPIVAMQAEGREAALAEHPALNVVATVNGDWTPTTTKTVVLQTLATNPADIDAVWTSGSESRLVTEAFVESGRDAPLVTGSISGDGLGYWNENPDGYRFTGQAVLPVMTGNPAVRVAVRILEGQGPKLNTLLLELPRVAQDDLGGWHSECMTSDSATTFPVAPNDPYPDELIDPYFEDPAPTPPYDYSTTPDPCG
jgi:ribose transport system substrate-binding protein